MSRLCIVILVGLVTFGNYSVYADESDLAGLESDLADIRIRMEAAKADAESYAGGLIHALILQRLETLRLTEALLNQRRIAIREGAKFTFELPAIRPDAGREAEIAQDLLAAMDELGAAEAEAARYSGGLVHALALTNVMTQRQTVAMLHQAAIAARYGLTVPKIDATTLQRTERVRPQQPRSSEKPPDSPKMVAARDCLKVAEYGSRLLDYNEVFAKVAWKVNIQNSCDKPFYVSVRFALQDVDEFELDSDTETIAVPPSGVGKARGQMLVSPTSTYDRAKYDKVSYQLAR